MGNIFHKKRSHSYILVYEQANKKHQLVAVTEGSKGEISDFLWAREQGITSKYSPMQGKIHPWNRNLAEVWD